MTKLYTKEEVIELMSNCLFFCAAFPPEAGFDEEECARVATKYFKGVMEGRGVDCQHRTPKNRQNQQKQRSVA